jgi:hypothetical protein
MLALPTRISRLLLTASLGCLILNGCSLLAPTHTVPRNSQPSTVAVLDFAVLPRLAESRNDQRRLIYTPTEVQTGKDRRGWWFTAQDIYLNSNAGRTLADELTKELKKSPELFEPMTREDVRVFLTDKVEILRETLKMEPADARRATLLLDPVQSGRALGVRYVIQGEVVDVEMRHNRATGIFGAAGSAQARLIDVQTGQTIAVANSRLSRFTATSLSILEGLAQDLARQLRAPLLKSVGE